jgi:hypothetical protein
MRRHLGSLIAIILGGLCLFAALGSPQTSGNLLFAGIFIVLSALAFRSRKRVRFGEKQDSVVRNVLEIGALIVSALLILLQTDLKTRVIADPVTLLIIPAICLAAYAFIRFRPVKVATE